MQLVCLNAWGGKIFKPLVKYIKELSDETDIFCFQEIFNTESSETEKYGYRVNLYQALLKVLADFCGYFAVQETKHVYEKLVNFPVLFGSAIFIKNSIHVKSAGDFVISDNNIWTNTVSKTPRFKAQHIAFVSNGKEYTICSVHGLCDWPKTDTPERVKQSQKILNFLKNISHSKILCGDFNLQSDSKSLALFKNSMIDLISEYKIPTTRSSLQKHNDEEGRLSDYVFVSPDIEVDKFGVPNVAVSDHLPLILNFK